jgi:hypothetical protein
MSTANRKRNVLVAAVLAFIPAVALLPALNLLASRAATAPHATLLAFLFMLACAAAEASALILAGRAMAGAFDAIEVGAVACLVAGVLTLGFIAWALATGFHP